MSENKLWSWRYWDIYWPIVVVWMAALYAQWERAGLHRIITWDVFGYYLYLPAVFIYGDADSFYSVEMLRETYDFSYDIYQINADRMPIYTIGMAILYAPFFLIGHMAALLLVFPADGLSAPYQWSVIIGSLVWVSVGYMALRKWLLHYFQNGVIRWTLPVLLFGTNLFCYVIYESGMPHAYLWGLYGLTIWGIHRWIQKPNIGHSVWIGLGMGVLCLARPSEVLVGLIWVLYPLQLAGKNIWIWQMQWWKRNSRGVLIVLMTGLLVVIPQIGFWFWRTGSLVYNAYGEAGHQFHFLHPHIIEGVFSFRKGWLVYSPLMIFSLLGLVYMAWRKVPAVWMVLVFFSLNIYWVLSWHMWWYAGSFGMRALIQSYAVLALAFGFAMYWLRKNLYTRRLLYMLIPVFIGLNLFQTWQYMNGILPGDQINAAFYLEVFGRTEKNINLNRLLDHPEVAPFKEDQFVQIAKMEANGEEDVFRRDGQPYQMVRQEKPYSMTIRVDSIGLKASGGWVRSIAHLYYEGERFTEYDAAGLVMQQLDADGVNKKWIKVSLQRCMEEGIPDEIAVDFKLTSDTADGDYLMVFIWNGSPDTIYLHSLQLMGVEKGL